MGRLKYLALVALLFSLSLAVFADKSNDATHHAKHDLKPSEATDAVEKPQAAKAEAEAETDVGVVDPELMRWRRCKYGCCGGKRFGIGRCKYCCRRPRAVGTIESESVQAKP